MVFIPSTCSRITSRVSSRIWRGTMWRICHLRADSVVWLSCMSSIWPWSSAPKVRLYNTFLGSLHHLPPQMKNQHGLNEEKNHNVKKIVSHIWVLVMWHVWLVWLLTTSSVRVCESGEKLCLLRLFNIYSLSRSSSNGFTLRIFILSMLFPYWTLIVLFVWTDVMSQGFLCHLDSVLWRISSFRSSTFWPTL